MPKENNTPIAQNAFNRVLWNSRRGMLELDVMLLPFARKVFPTLTDIEQHRFIRLLTHEDTELFSWFFHPDKQPEDPDMVSILNLVKQYARENTPQL